MSLFFFSMGFNNLIAWYSNVGRDGSQWNYLVDRINTLLGPVIVWIFSSTIVLNILSRSENFPNYLTTSEDGVMSSIEFILWPLWLVSIYLVMVLFAPFTIYLHKKYPYATVLTLITMTILIDNIDFALSMFLNDSPISKLLSKSIITSLKLYPGLKNKFLKKIIGLEKYPYLSAETI